MITHKEDHELAAQIKADVKPFEPINYTDAELEILSSSKVSDEDKWALYQSKLIAKVEASKEAVLIAVIKSSVKNCGKVSNVKGDLVDGSKITWTSVYSHGQIEECSGCLDIDEDSDMFIWE